MPTDTSTQQFVNIDNIRNDIVIVKSGEMRAILQTSSLNLALKSREEQEAIIFSYQNFINSLDFPIQILSNSRRANIDEYIQNLEQLTKGQTSELLQIQTEEYIDFISEFVRETNIISTNFYVIVPLSLMEIETLKGGAGERLKFILGKGEQIGKLDEERFNHFRRQLMHRVNFVVSGLYRLGLTVEILNTKELISLFWSLYNPEGLRRQALIKSIFG
jgi:hypothetical protein